MGAERHLSEPQFHGTYKDIRAGSLIRPAAQRGGPTNYPGLSNPEYTHSTPSLPSAAGYAERAVDWAYNRGEKGTRRVYEVQHTGPTENDPNEINALRSKSPMKVIRRVPVSEYEPK